jgi:hypothetical protein
MIRKLTLILVLLTLSSSVLAAAISLELQMGQKDTEKFCNGLRGDMDSVMRAYTSTKAITRGEKKKYLKLNNTLRLKMMRQASAHLADVSTAYKNLCMK